MSGEQEERGEEQEAPLQEGYKRPYFPYDAEPRRWDGNEMLGDLTDTIGLRASVLLRFRPLEFVYTLLSGPVIYEAPDDVPLTGEKVEERITTEDQERLKDLYEHSQGLMEREEETRASVEGRANVLLGAGGLTATLIIGVSGLLARGDFADVLPSDTLFRTVFVMLYLTVLLALVMSLLRALQAVRVVSHQPFSATLPFDVQEQEPAPRLRRLIREAFLTFVDLRLMNRIKAGHLRAAQWWFGAALFALLLLAAVPVLAAPATSVWSWLKGLLCTKGATIITLLAIVGVVSVVVVALLWRRRRVGLQRDA